MMSKRFIAIVLILATTGGLVIPHSAQAQSFCDYIGFLPIVSFVCSNSYLQIILNIKEIITSIAGVISLPIGGKFDLVPHMFNFGGRIIEQTRGCRLTYWVWQFFTIAGAPVPVPICPSCFIPFSLIFNNQT